MEDGDHVDLSIMETQAGSIDRQTALLVNYQYTGNRYSRPDASEAYLGGVYPALDGYLDVQVIERFPQLLAAMGQPDTITESEAVELAIFLDKWENADGNPLESGELIKELGVMLEKWVRARPMGQAWAQFQRHGTLSASFNDAAGVHAGPEFQPARTLDEGGRRGVGAAAIARAHFDTGAYALAGAETGPGPGRAQQ